MAASAELAGRERTEAVKRRKLPALPVPATDAEAMELLIRYVANERALRALREISDEQIAAIEARRDKLITEAAPEQTQRFGALKAWWEAGGAERMAKKKRSADLAGAKIGIRLGNKSVRLPKGTKAEAIVDWLRELRWMGASRFVRTKYSLDKDAIIAAWPKEADTRKTFGGKGVTVAQDDEFFIEVGPADTKPAASE